MLSQQRQKEITDIILKEGKAYISDLAKRFRVSGETIRRDLGVICKEQNILKVHGGAIALQAPKREDSYRQRLVHNVDVKQEIGSLAARFIEDNDTIVIDSGTTAEYFANAILGRQNLRLVTRSLTIANILLQKIRQGEISGSVIFLGGVLKADSYDAGGELMLSMLNRFLFDKAFISMTAVSEKGGWVWDVADGIIMQHIIARSAQVYVLIESEKFTQVSFYNCTPFEDMDHIITDGRHPIDPKVRSALLASDAKIHIASAREDERE